MPSKIDYLRPQDILVLLKLLYWKKGATWTYSELSKDLKLSQSEVYAAVQRAELASLYDPMTRRPNRAALIEFLVHGIRYAFPARPGTKARGIPTAHSGPPLIKQIVSNGSDAYVWESSWEKSQGLPLSPSTTRCLLQSSAIQRCMSLSP